MMQIVVDSLARSAELSLLAVGLTMVYGVLRFGNFAHVEFATTGAYLALALSVGVSFAVPAWGWQFQLELPLVVAAVASIVLVGLLGILTDKLIFARLRTAPAVMLMIASFALGIVLRESVRAIFGPSGHIFELGLLRPWEVLGARVTPTQAGVIGAALVSIVAFYLLLSRTRLGIAMRATADNAALAQASGASAKRIIATVWFIGSGFAALGGILVGLNTQVKPELSDGLIIEVFAAAIVGGIGNPYGAMLGALLIGVAENVGLSINWAPLLQAVGFDTGDFVHIPAGWKAAIPFALLILTLLIRPQGLLGARR